MCYEKKIAFDEIVDIRICEFPWRDSDGDDVTYNNAEILLRSGENQHMMRLYIKTVKRKI